MRSETRIRGAVLGVDIGYSRDRNTTGLCLLKWDEERVSVTCVNTGTPSSQRRLDLQSLVPEGTQLAAVAIDGPLTRGLQEISRYRSAEALLSRGVFQKRGKPGQTNSGNGQDLHLSATAFAWLLLDLEASGWLSLSASEHSEPIHNTAMVEAFPNQFLAALVDEREIPVIRGDASDRPWSDRYWDVLAQNGGLERLLSGFLPGRDLEFNIADVLDHEKRAGIVCALTALCIACGSYVGVGDPVDGTIILPPASSWGKTQDGQGRWMELALRESLPKVRGRSGVYPNHAFASITWAE